MRAVESLPFRIGRGEADFPMPFDTAISVQHVELDFSDGGYTIQDLHSSNGSFVNNGSNGTYTPNASWTGIAMLGEQISDLRLDIHD